MNKGPIEDRLEIRELIEAFAAAVMDIDAEKWGATWAEEGSWKLPSMESAVTGRDKVMAAFKEKMEYVKCMSMISFPAEMVVDGDRATGKAYCRELIYPKTGGQLVVLGYFDDEYIKRDGRWQFLSRVYQVIGKEQHV